MSDKDLAASAGTGYKSRAKAGKLVIDHASGHGDGLITAYLAYEYFRTRSYEVFDVDGDKLERLRIVNWYLTSYASHRRQRIPLSARQLEVLNAPLPMIDFARKISMISYWFIERELGREWNLVHLKVANEAIYWWCVERLPVMKMEDALIPSYYVEYLNEIDAIQRWMPFHVNYFVSRYHEVHPDVQFLNLAVEPDRIALLCYLALKCGDEPHLVQFLPREGIGRLFAPYAPHPEFVMLDSLLAMIPSVRGGHATKSSDGFDDETQKDEDESDKTTASAPLLHQLQLGKQIRETLVRNIESAGYSLRSGRRIDDMSGGHFAQCFKTDPTISDVVSDGICVVGPIEAASGLGQATRMSIDVIRSITPEISVENFQMDNPAPLKPSRNPLPQRVSLPRRINLIHLNAESIPLAFAYQDRRFYERSYNIGYFFWELTKIPSCHYLALDMLDEIWVSSEYDREIYAGVTNIPVVNVGMMVEPIGEAPAATRSSFGLPADTFIFLATFDSFSFVERKNPLGVIAAFRRAFPDHDSKVALVLKTQNKFKVDDLYQRKIWAQILQSVNLDPRIIIINETFDFQELLSFKSLCDCYVSLHRSEGWGFGLIEAMQLGLPVIATGYSGNMEFCNPENCYLVDYELVAPMPHEYIFVERGSLWADPSVDDAARRMIEVREIPQRAKALARRAKSDVAKGFGKVRIAERYAGRLREIAKLVGDAALRAC